MSKLISFVVPCYNSQDYMERCIDSLLVGGDDVEIIIVDDGSTDNTGSIADVYANVFPNIVNVVHKENGGHGSGVNAGLKLAQGIYFKVVDSDDWLETEAYERLLKQIKDMVSAEKLPTGDNNHFLPDLIVTNYVYDHLMEKTSHIMNYRNVFPVEEVCSWNEIRSFFPSQYLIMHALLFQTSLLRKTGIQLPEHTFFVDNIFAYQPLPLVEKIYYMDINLYHYFIGREDQSVNEKMLMKRIDQQIKVTEIVENCVDIGKVREIYPKLANYMYRDVSVMITISSVHLLLIATKEAYVKRKKLWSNMKMQNRRMYYRLHYTTLSGLTCLPGKLGRKVVIEGYRIAKRKYQFQ